tara:strand:- start:145 stop:312 length:168 start_codon:yes stop_codon:yes gene_type:complete
MKQVSSVKRISDYKQIYIPDAVMEDMDVKAGDNVVWMFDEMEGNYILKKATVTIE